VIAKLNSTGTHIYKGFLKVRIDLYPEPTDKTYSQHYVSKPVIPPEGYPGGKDIFGGPLDPVEYKAWEDALPHIMELNPCLCHFLKIDPGTTPAELMSEVKALFDPNTIYELDTILSELKPGYLDKVSKRMSGRGGKVNPAGDANPQVINSRFSGLEFQLGN
jgi:hypothetical protein